MSDISNLKQLGTDTKYDFSEPNPKLLERFENQHQDTPYLIPIKAFEFSSLCPRTGQPDWATLWIKYVPNKWCVESKALKLYLFSFRNHGEFMEDCTNRIAKVLIEFLEPYYLEIYAEYNSRGGISLTPFVRYSYDGSGKFNDLVKRYNEICR